jgi:hypothetical protein
VLFTRILFREGTYTRAVRVLPISATATRRSFASYSGNPAVNDIGSAATAIIWINIDGISRTVLSASSAFHATVSVGDLGLSIPNPENAVRTDQFAGSAADALFLC